MISLLLALSPAMAQEVTVAINPDVAQQAGMDPGELDQAFSAEIPDQLQMEDFDAFLEQMARATALSTKGMGVDYGSNPQKFVVGGSVGSAVNGAGAQFGRGDSTVSEGGFAFQATAMAGLNLGAGFKLPEDKPRWKRDQEAREAREAQEMASEAPQGDAEAGSADDSPSESEAVEVDMGGPSFGRFMRRFVVYGHGMMLNTEGDPFGGQLINYGGHLQVQLVRPRIAGLAEWGGLALTSGYTASTYKLSLNYPLPLEVQGVTWEADGAYTISSQTWSVPVELSTNMRLLFLTVYGGVGQDAVSYADAGGEILLDGPITTTVQGEEYRLGRASASAQRIAETRMVLPRGFVGVQADVFILKLYGHLNADLEGGFGGHVGARLAL